MTEHKAERAPWGDFPAVVRNGDLKDLSKEPEYEAAKHGDHKAMSYK
ncbi:TraN, partial [Klebsiella pneumoniae]|nr:TraN [Klebsiella pneumoniae]